MEGLASGTVIKESVHFFILSVSKTFKLVSMDPVAT